MFNIFLNALSLFSDKERFIINALLFFLSDACIISEDRMNKNNIQLKWRTPPVRYAKTGDFIEFECKRSHKEKTPLQSFRVLCQEGKFEYPTCE